MKIWAGILILALGTLNSVRGQSANDDFYTAPSGSAFTVSAPGVLTNDTGTGLTATLVNGPANGALTLNANGSFTYTPTNNFTGMDGFTYEAVSAGQPSDPANVDIMVLGPGEFFHDNFLRPSDDGSISPWTQISSSSVAGTWSLSDGMMLGDSPEYTYGYAWCGNTNWTDYAVQGQIQFSTSQAGSAGLFGRLNPVTGAHYAAWIYPEESNENNIPPLNGIPQLQLIKYRNWTTFTLIGPRVALPEVGTDWHTVKLAFKGAMIATYFDGVLVTNVIDDGSINNRPAYTNGAVGLNLWSSGPPSYTLSVSNFTVTSLVLNDRYTATENTMLTVTNPGVLNNDTDVYGTNLTTTLVTGPTHGTLTLNSNGGFAYTPATNFAGTDSFTCQANDGPNHLGTSTVTITVIPLPPVISSISLAGNTIAITWTAAIGATYRLQSKDTLSSGVWNDLLPDVTATGPTASQTNVVGAVSQRFYRVKVVAP